MRNIIYFVINLCLGILTIVASNSSKSDFLVLSGIVIVAIVGDYLLKVCETDYLRAFADSCTHGLIGLLSWLLVTLHRGHRYNQLEIVICGFFASLIDVDHFLKAKSIRLNDALHLVGGRPVLHNSTIPVVILAINICVICCVGTRSVRLIRFGWILWTAFTSHHVRDANRRGLWFYPFGSTPPLSNVFYILSILLLPYLTIFLMKDDVYRFFLLNSNNIVSMTSTFSNQERDGGRSSNFYSSIHIV